DVDLLKIENPKAPSGMKYAVVLGAGRSAYGLGFYRSSDDYVLFRRGAHRSDPRLPGVWQVSFDPIMEVPPGDIDLWEDHHLPLASEQAYPAAMWFGARGEVKRPTAKQLAFLEGLLRAFSETTEAEIDSGRWQQEAETHDGPALYTLAIPDLLTPPSFQEWIKRGFEPDRRAHERMFADMNRYFRDHPPADIDEMNEATAHLFSGRKIDDLVTQPETPQERAQELCYQAFDTHGRRRVQLAREAIQVCPDCADAYVILAEQAGTLEAELENYTSAMATAERVLGPEAFEESIGHFWGVSSTRPYMRARFGLAQSLEQLGQLDEAVNHYQDMLRLNPNDNQGVRYLLMPKLLQLGRDAESARLLKQYDEESANWAYARALLAFRLSGKSAAACRELRDAFRTNPHVPELLVEEEPLPMPPHYSPGSPEEAIVCAEELAAAFAETEGALAWLAAEHSQRQKEVAARRKEQRKKQRGQKRKRKGR
ncbi:MAG: tetratricopeptide repeat protein, partial [Planctomycetota bacterium]